MIALRYRRHAPLVLVSALALALAALLIRVRYELDIKREILRAHSLLEARAADLGVQIDHGELTLIDGSDRPLDTTWHRWQLSSSDVQRRGVSPLPLSAATLIRAVNERLQSGRSSHLLGPFGTEQSRDVFVLMGRTPSGAAASDASIVWAFADEIAARAHLANMMASGYRLQLFDPVNAVALYQTDPGDLREAVVVPLEVGGTTLELRAAPRNGWSVPLHNLGPSLLVALAVFAWVSHEAWREWRRRDAIASHRESEIRRREANLAYGKALENLAELESRLQLVSMYDTVTGLANRSSMIRRIDTILESMRLSPRAGLSIMAIGFDHIHHITNSFGAEFASRVLVIAAERVEHLLPSKDLLFRTGDVNLALVLPETQGDRCIDLAQQIIAEIEAPIALDSHTFMLHPSVGIVENKSGYEYAEALLDRATTALAAVPRDSPSRYCLFDSATARESVSRLQLEVDLDRAFGEDQFVLEYEPFVRPGSFAVAGFEALIRWNHPTEGKLSPGRFVPIAVQAGMSHRLNEWVMRKAAQQAATWHRAGHRDFFVNFNLSAEAFLRPNLTEEIGELLAEFELPGEYLIVELTESTLIQDLRSASRTLQRLSELGVGAWLDDFGTGYSSLSHLRSLPLKGVKIDRSFIERIVIDSRDCGFVKALVDLIGYLGMQAIAEGIESKEQYDVLSLTACDLYQGYHFSRSLVATQAERWLASPERSLERAAGP